MKSLIFSLVPLALVSANPIEPRDLGPNNPLGPLLAAIKASGAPVTGESAIAVLPKAKFVKVEELKPTLRPEAKRLAATYGPYTLVGKDEPRPKSMGKSLDPKGQAFIDLITEGLCSDCYVLTGKVLPTFENGKTAGPADGIYIHHIVTSDLTKREDLPVNKCAKANKTMPNLGADFLAQGDDSLGAGNKFVAVDGPATTGFYLSKNAKIMSNVDIVHYSDKPQVFYLKGDIEYLPAKKGMRDAEGVIMSVTGCPAERVEYGAKDGLVIKLNPDGPATTDGYKYPIRKDTTLVAALGHLHDGGSGMVLTINDKEVCESKAIYGNGGANNEQTIVKMTPCPTGIKMKKGDIMSMKTIYDIKAHPMRHNSEHSGGHGMPDVMGMFYMTFSNDP